MAGGRSAGLFRIGTAARLLRRGNCVKSRDSHRAG
jgi:hypothetical protein